MFGEEWCIVSVILAFVFASASWMALSMIALSGALLVAFPSISKHVFSNKKSKMIIIVSWTLVLLLYAPLYIEVF